MNNKEFNKWEIGILTASIALAVWLMGWIGSL